MLQQPNNNIQYIYLFIYFLKLTCWLITLLYFTVDPNGGTLSVNNFQLVFDDKRTYSTFNVAIFLESPEELMLHLVVCALCSHVLCGKDPS